MPCSSSNRYSARARASSVFPTPVGPREHEAPQRPLRIAKPSAGAPHGVGDCPDGLLLANDTLVEPLLHMQQLVGLSLQQPVHRYPGPACYEPADRLRVHGHVVGTTFHAGGLFGVVLRLQAGPLRAQAGSPLVIGPLGRGLLFVGEMAQFGLLVLQGGRQPLRVDADLARRLVDRVDRLVGATASRSRTACSVFAAASSAASVRVTLWWAP